MSLTIGNYIFICAIAICGFSLAIVAYVFSWDNGIRNAIITGVITIFICICAAFGLNWYNTSTASGIRSYKDHKSNLSNGINREITITAEDGREIFHYEGKIDVESNHEDNYIKFESENGKRYIIYYGIQDTIIIKEK